MESRVGKGRKERKINSYDFHPVYLHFPININIENKGDKNRIMTYIKDHNCKTNKYKLCNFIIYTFSLKKIAVLL